MIERLRVSGFLSLVDTEVNFAPLTVLLGRNGAGKTALLDSLERIGSFARGGVERAFGAPPFSLGNMRTRGHGEVPTTTFEVALDLKQSRYDYLLSIEEQRGRAVVAAERLKELPSAKVIATLTKNRPPHSGTILRPEVAEATVELVAEHLRTVRVFDLNPRSIELPSDEDQQVLRRDGEGIGAFLAALEASDPKRFDDLQHRLRSLRSGTVALRTWGGQPGTIYWGIEERNAETWRHPAPLLSWGDRLLVGVLCVLYASEGGTVVGLEEIDRGYHPSRYEAIVELMSEASYHGIAGRDPLQIIATSHSPSLVSRFHDRLDELRIVRRVEGGVTTVVSVEDAVKDKLHQDKPQAPIGEVWAMGLLD